MIWCGFPETARANHSSSPPPAIYLIMTLGKLRDSITDSGGKVRYEVLKEVSYVTPIASVFISDGALSLLL